jgi:hypothetical protein
MPLIVQQMATLHVLHSEKQSQVSLAVWGLYQLPIKAPIKDSVPVGASICNIPGWSVVWLKNIIFTLCVELVLYVHNYFLVNLPLLLVLLKFLGKCCVTTCIMKETKISGSCHQLLIRLDLCPPLWIQGILLSPKRS